MAQRPSSLRRQNSAGGKGQDGVLRYSTVQLNAQIANQPITLPSDEVGNQKLFSFDFCRFERMLKTLEHQQNEDSKAEREQEEAVMKAERDVRGAEEAQRIAEETEAEERRTREEASRQQKQQEDRAQEWDQRRQQQQREASLVSAEQTKEVVAQRLRGLGFTDAQITEAQKRCTSFEACSNWILEHGS